MVPRCHPDATQLSRDMTKVATGLMGRARASFPPFSSSASGEVGPFLAWGSYLGLPTAVPLMAVHPFRFWLVPFYVAF